LPRGYTKKYLLSLFPVLIAALLILPACKDTGKTVEPPRGTRTITDMAGRTVTVPQDIKKVYCTSPPGTLLLYTLAPEKMVGWNSNQF